MKNNKTNQAKNPVLLMVYIHDDLDGYDEGKLYDDHFAWLKTELEYISGRDVTIIFNSKSTSPGMTQYHYKNESVYDSGQGWKAMVKALTSKVEETRPYDPDLNKFLFVNPPPDQQQRCRRCDRKGSEWNRIDFLLHGTRARGGPHVRCHP
ncbi:hypothetical protein [Pseudomonas fluorescens]|uniref:hypothetical protein n=1 Tax=Pseudomonas fluorescens TaxID=294 RepID=UPI00124214CC|nr:hypothetical protein [Pseudomonas fluorescens]